MFSSSSSPSGVALMVADSDQKTLRSETDFDNPGISRGRRSASVLRRSTMAVIFSPETEAWIAERKSKGEDPKTKAWLDERKREGLLIDPATAEVDWSFGQTLDPYGIIPDLPEELQQVGREYFARRPGATFGLTSATYPTMSARSCGSIRTLSPRSPSRRTVKSFGISTCRRALSRRSETSFGGGQAACLAAPFVQAPLAGPKEMNMDRFV
jgi:hypothetical protein